MRWISKTPPGYVWEDDSWFNEKDRKTYMPDMQSRQWRGENEIIEFPPKTKTFTVQETNLKWSKLFNGPNTSVNQTR